MRAVVIRIGRAEPQPAVLEIVGERVVPELAVRNRPGEEERQASEGQDTVQPSRAPRDDLDRAVVSISLPESPEVSTRSG